MTSHTVSVVIVTWRAFEATRRCLDALKVVQSESDLIHEVVVVDNDSGDGSVERLRSEFDARFIERPDNGGFAVAVNEGFRATEAPNVLLLNPDAVLDTDCLEPLVDTLNRERRVAAAGPRLIDEDGRFMPTGRALPSARSELFKILGRFRPDDEESRSVGWICGACMLIRRSAWDRIGPFDERFFLYFEETDWCLRARRAGHEIHLIRDAVAFHEGGRSARESGGELLSGCLADHFRRSRTQFFAKHHGALTARLLDGLRDLAEGVRQRRATQKRVRA